MAAGRFTPSQVFLVCDPEMIGAWVAKCHKKYKSLDHNSVVRHQQLEEGSSFCILNPRPLYVSIWEG